MSGAAQEPGLHMLRTWTGQCITQGFAHHFPLVQPLVHKHTHTYTHIHLHHMLKMPYISSIAIYAIWYWSQNKMLKLEKKKKKVCVKKAVT